MSYNKTVITKSKACRPCQIDYIFVALVYYQLHVRDTTQNIGKVYY